MVICDVLFEVRTELLNFTKASVGFHRSVTLREELSYRYLKRNYSENISALCKLHKWKK
jgi:hypothetical protein